ncbi:MAG: MCE family protein, partial [Lentisphaeria bacterium]|nr:MCE family protein [Lentisphaeria bacterium]
MQETNKFKLGLFVIGSILVLIIVIFSMGLFDHFKPKAYIVTFVEESVQGLTTGSSVKYKGVPIGKVSDISIMVDNNDIRINMEINLTKIQERTGNKTGNQPENRYLTALTKSHVLDRDKFYDFLQKASREGLACRIEPDGITGSKYVEINFFSDEKTPRSTRQAFFDKQGHFIMPSTPSMMANLRTNIFEILTSVASVDFKGISKQTHELLVRANQTLDRAKLDQLAVNADEVIRKIDLTVSNLNQVLDQKQMRTAIHEMEESLKAVRALAVKIEQSVDRANLSETAGDIRQLTRSLRDSSETLQISLRKADETMDTITDLVRYMNDNPASLLHGRGVAPKEN